MVRYKGHSAAGAGSALLPEATLHQLTAASVPVDLWESPLVGRYLGLVFCVRVHKQEFKEGRF